MGNLDVFVVSAVHAPTNGTGWSADGLVFAGVLLLLGLCVFLFIWATLVRPLLRLLDHARAVACGGLGRHARLPRLAEMRRIAHALDDSRASIHGRRPIRRDGRYAVVPALLPVFVSALAIAAWSGAVMVTFSHRPVDLPSPLAADTHNQVEAAAASVRSVLEQGLAQLTRVARDNADRKPQEVRPALHRLTRDSSRYRSAYVAETNGRTVATAGKEPLRHGGRVPDGDGVQLDTTVGRVPTIFVHARLSATHVLIAEFDIRYLTSVLRHVDGRVRLVDQDMRTVLDTEGFLAFQKLSAEAPRRAADDALKGHPRAEVTQVHGIRSLIASAPIAAAPVTAGPVVPAPAAPAPGAAAPARNQPAGVDPHWVVVAERPLSEYQLPTNELRRGAWMVGIAGLCLALLLFGWLYFLVLLPLRALARAADRLAAGDLDTVIPPARQDELGAIAVCLDICRQAKAYGTERLAGAIRLRGTVRDQTLVLPCIPSQRQRPQDSVDSTKRRR
jgi:HAMP domain-containing protein